MNVLEGILWVLAGILGLLVALLFLPVGVQVRYDDSGFRISLLAGPIRWQLLPAKSGWLHRKWTRSKSEKAPKPAPKKVAGAQACPQGGSLVGTPAILAGAAQPLAGVAAAPSGAAVGVLGEAGRRGSL